MCYCNLFRELALAGLLSFDCMAIVTLSVIFSNLQIDIATQKYKNGIKALIYNSFMALYCYIKNDITDGSLTGSAGVGVCVGWEWVGMGWNGLLHYIGIK